jgi:adenine-specific DNA methylase
MADDQVTARYKTPPSFVEVEQYATPDEREILYGKSGVEGVKPTLTRNERIALTSSIICRMPYLKRSEKLFRPEEVEEQLLADSHFEEINAHLGTEARSLNDLVEQLGIMRFGGRPRVGDVFCGGGSIPFEAARLGCNVYASDLNPLACMLTWGALNIVGATAERRSELAKAEDDLIRNVEAEIDALGIERDNASNRAKAYLYCLETRCPQTNWMVPLSPSWVISKSKRVIALLVPERERGSAIESTSGLLLLRQNLTRRRKERFRAETSFMRLMEKCFVHLFEPSAAIAKVRTASRFPTCGSGRRQISRLGTTMSFRSAFMQYNGRRKRRCRSLGLRPSSPRCLTRMKCAKR